VGSCQYRHTQFQEPLRQAGSSSQRQEIQTSRCLYKDRGINTTSEERIRLTGIDCAEKGQAYGINAKQAT